MNKIIFLSFICMKVQAQNVGIGTISPTIARIEVVGSADTSNTAAAFGTDGAGISFQSNFPTVGFNQYNKQNSGYGNYMFTGSAASIVLNSNTGILSLNVFNNEQFNGIPGVKYEAITVSKNVFNINSNGNFAIGKLAENNIGFLVGNTNNSGNSILRGTTFHSTFGYNDTYINGGKTGSKVIINDIPNGNIIVGGRTEVSDLYNVFGGVNSLSVSGAIAFTKRDEHDVCTGGLYNPGNSSYVNVKRTGCSNAQPFAIANGIVEGQLLIIQAEGNNGFTVYDQNNINLPGNTQMGGGDIMMLIWNGYFSKWEQVSYSNN